MYVPVISDRERFDTQITGTFCPSSLLLLPALLLDFPPFSSSLSTLPRRTDRRRSLVSVPSASENRPAKTYRVGVSSATNFNPVHPLRRRGGSAPLLRRRASFSPEIEPRRQRFPIPLVNTLGISIADSIVRLRCENGMNRDLRIRPAEQRDGTGFFALSKNSR